MWNESVGLFLVLFNEMKHYGFTPISFLFFAQLCSWPILKCLLESFNPEELEQYTARSYKISSGQAEENDLPSTQTNLLFTSHRVVTKLITTTK